MLSPADTWPPGSLVSQQGIGHSWLPQTIAQWYQESKPGRPSSFELRLGLKEFIFCKFLTWLKPLRKDYPSKNDKKTLYNFKVTSKKNVNKHHNHHGSQPQELMCIKSSKLSLSADILVALPAYLSKGVTSSRSSLQFCLDFCTATSVCQLNSFIKEPRTKE